MTSTRRILVSEATYEETHGPWPILVCFGCKERFVWVYDGPEDGATRPDYHSKACKKSSAQLVSTSWSRRSWTPPRGVSVSSQRCPTCGKVAAPTLEAAKMEKARIEKSTGHRDVVRYYTCESGYFHWTRMNATMGG